LTPHCCLSSDTNTGIFQLPRFNCRVMPPMKSFLGYPDYIKIIPFAFEPE
jgi:hypothetical protein